MIGTRELYGMARSRGVVWYDWDYRVLYGWLGVESVLCGMTGTRVLYGMAGGRVLYGMAEVEYCMAWLGVESVLCGWE
jgi:hypothetical protein